MLAKEQLLCLAAAAQPQPWGTQQRVTVTSHATSHQFCSGGLAPHCSSQDQTHGKASYFSEAKLGLGFCRKKKKERKKKSNKNWNLFQSKINGSTQALQLLQNPPALQSPSSTNTNRSKRLLTEDPQLCSPLVATLRGLLVPAWSTQLATLPPASTSLSQQHYLVPLKSHHGCHTAERTGPRQSQPIPAHLWFTSSFRFVTLPQKVKKKKNQEVVTFQIHSGI